jgi:hypothetical protein
MHPNPKFYKYYWWVFWKGSPVDGDEFLSSRYRMPTAAAAQLLEELREKGEPFWLYNRQLPRKDADNTPFDPDAPRWKNAEWAPPYDQDPDAVWNGHK